MGLFGKKRDDDSDVLVIDENDSFYNPPADGDDSLPQSSDYLPVPDDDDEDEVDEDENEGKGILKSRRSRNKSRRRRERGREEAEAVEEEEPEEFEWPTPVKPSLSLPSRSIVENSLATTASLRMRKVLVIVGCGLLAAGITSTGLNFYSASQLAGVQAEGQTLEAQVKKMQPIADFYDGYTARRDAVSKVLATDIQFSQIQGSLFSTAAQNGVTVVSETIEPGQPCASLDPFAPSEGLGCVTVELESDGGTASLADVSEEIEQDNGISGAYITNISTAEGTTTATLNFNYDSAILSDRYRMFSTPGSSAPDSTGQAAETEGE